MHNITCYLFLFYCVICLSHCHVNFQHRYSFQIGYEWSYLNFTWPSSQVYVAALKNGKYIPENNAPAGLKIFNEELYLSIPRFRKGIPVTLAYIHMGGSERRNTLLAPFPNWVMNDDSSCSNLQSVQSMEIDTNGMMWVLDGVRLGNNNNCPSKLVLLDLKSHKLLHSYVFPNEISLQNGGFLNDIVVDDSNGGFAYLTDNSNIDPGLIVYSMKNDRAWKIRDRTMFPEPWVPSFFVGNVLFDSQVPIDGIALSPRPFNPTENRTVFYSALSGLNLYAISTTALKDKLLCRSDKWRKHIQYVGKKQGQTDGMVIDSRGTLFYTLMSFYGVGSWNIWKPFTSSKILGSNRDTMVWPDGFAMDQRGYLYLISNSIFNYINNSTKLDLTNDVKFRIFQLYTGTRSYLYSE